MDVCKGKVFFMNALMIIGCVVAVLAIAWAALAIITHVVGKADDKRRENMTEEERRAENWNMDEYKYNQMTHS